MNFTKAVCLVMVLLLNAYVFAANKEASFTINGPNIHQTFSRSDLLKMPSLKVITISNNRAYPNTSMSYQVIPLCDLLKFYHFEKNDQLEFIATDKFSVLIPPKKIMACNQKNAIAYLAIEPESKWPILFNHTGTTAGPFAVLWLHPEKSYISDEYWAWSVVEVRIHPKLDPTKFLSAPKVTNPHILNGYEKYISHCAACHAMNGVGKGVIGPDLNIPKNPIEYYPDPTTLKRFIRQPESVRKIKNGRMNGSDARFLSDRDLEDLISYFQYMAQVDRKRV